MPDADSPQRQKRQQIRAARIELTERFPAIFIAPSSKEPKRPLKIGIAKDVIAALRAGGSTISGKLARNAIHDYCCGPKYTLALAAGGPRYDLDGQPDGAVLPDRAKIAAQQLMRMER